MSNADDCGSVLTLVLEALREGERQMVTTAFDCVKLFGAFAVCCFAQQVQSGNGLGAVTQTGRL